MPFDPRAETYSLDNARTLARAAAISYSEADACQAWARANGFTEDFDFFSSRDRVFLADTQGFIAQSPDAVLVVFRGTEVGRQIDWLSDFQAEHETWGHPAGTVHKGFYEALRAVWGTANVLPKRLLGRGNRAVWIAGHSLGGALAELCAAQAFFVEHVPVQGLYTFGQPRVGSERYATAVTQAYGSRAFRHVNDRDAVPRVPLFGMGYRHSGTQIFFDHQGARTVDAPAVETLAASLRLARLALAVDPVAEAASLMSRAVLEAGFLGNFMAKLEEIMRSLERGPDVEKLLREGTANIADHHIEHGYLARLMA